MTPTEQYNKELYHYGVKGMKWGVRKNPAKAYAKAVRKKRKLDASVYYNTKNLEAQRRYHKQAEAQLAESQKDLSVKKAKMELATENYNRNKDQFLANAGKSDLFNKGVKLSKTPKFFITRVFRAIIRPTVELTVLL